MKPVSTELAELAHQAREVFRQGYLDPLAHVSAPVSAIAALPQASMAPVDRDAMPEERKSVRVSPGAVLSPAIQPVASLDLTGLDSGQAVDHINGLVKACTACQLCKTRTKTVPGTGSIHPIAMVIGEAPGADEDRVGLPFVGAAGQFLDKWLEAIGLSRYSNIYICNTIKCRPPQNRDPSPDEVQACAAYLRAQIDSLKPKAILTLGRFASAWLMGREVVMGDVHGKVFDFQGIPWLPTYHPSAVLRNAELKRPVWEDLKAFKVLYQQ